MRSHARIVASCRDGLTRFDELRTAPPITLRQIGIGRVAMVSSAAWPVAGDELALDITIGSGARVTVTSVAASMAYPSPRDARSALTVRAVVGDGARLEWVPEPTVLVAGCNHTVTASLHVDEGAQVRWREETRLGRWGEPTGSWWQRTFVDVAGAPLYRSDVGFGPAWSPTVDEHVAVGTAFASGGAAVEPAGEITDELAWSANPIGADAANWIVLAARMSTMRRKLAGLIDHGWSSEAARIAQ